MLLKCCIHYVNKFGKTSSGHRTGKGLSSSQFPRRAVLNNVQTIRKWHSLLMLVRLCSKSFEIGFSSTWIENFQMYKLGREKAEEPDVRARYRKGRGTRDQIDNIRWIIEKAREFQKTSTSVSLPDQLLSITSTPSIQQAWPRNRARPIAPLQQRATPAALPNCEVKLLVLLNQGDWTVPWAALEPSLQRCPITHTT